MYLYLILNIDYYIIFYIYIYLLIFFFIFILIFISLPAYFIIHFLCASNAVYLSICLAISIYFQPFSDIFTYISYRYRCILIYICVGYLYLCLHLQLYLFLSAQHLLHICIYFSAFLNLLNAQLYPLHILRYMGLSVHMHLCADCSWSAFSLRGGSAYFTCFSSLIPCSSA